jgi:Flp pilus assembly protein TadD
VTTVARPHVWQGDRGADARLLTHGGGHRVEPAHLPGIGEFGAGGVMDAVEPDTVEPDAVELYREATRLLAERRVREATAVAEELARVEPEAPSALELLARVYFAAARLEKAAAAFGRLVEADPADAYARIGLARSLQRLSRHDEAAVHARVAAALQPGADTLELLEAVTGR